LGSRPAEHSDASSAHDYYEIAKLVNERLVRPGAATSTSTSTSTSTASDDVVIELPGGPSIGLSFSEYRELIARVNGFPGAWDRLVSALSPRLRQAFLALYKHSLVYYDYSLGAYRVNFARLMNRVRVLRAPVEVLKYYMPRQPASHPVAPATQLQLVERPQVERVEEAGEALGEAVEAGEELTTGAEGEKRPGRAKLTKPKAHCVPRR
jgi:hypothetical protein